MTCALLRSKTRLLLILSAFGLSLVSSTAFAAGSLTNYQHITAMQANSLNGSNPTYVIVSFDADMATPACGNKNSITFDATTATGKVRLSLFQAAMLSGKTVRVTGGGTCVGGVETLGWSGFSN